jgi:hypothetical protein
MCNLYSINTNQAGRTVVDLINANSKGKASPQITSVEIRFTRVLPGQSFFVVLIGYSD